MGYVRGRTSRRGLACQVRVHVVGGLRGAHFIGPMSPDWDGLLGLLLKNPFCVPTEMTSSVSWAATAAAMAMSTVRPTIDG